MVQFYIEMIYNTGEFLWFKNLSNYNILRKKKTKTLVVIESLCLENKNENLKTFNEN